MILKPTRKRMVLGEPVRKRMILPAVPQKRRMILRESGPPSKYPKGTLNGKILVDFDKLVPDNYYWWAPYRRNGESTVGHYPVLATGSYIMSNWTDQVERADVKGKTYSKGPAKKKKKRKGGGGYLPLVGYAVPDNVEYLEKVTDSNCFNLLLPSGTYEQVTEYSPSYIRWWLGQDPKRKAYLLQA